MKNTNNSVKKHQSYLVLLLALLLCGSVNAKVKHLVGGYAQIGEWSLLPKQSDYTGSLGVAGGLGFQYELQAGQKYSPAQFLLDLGVGATYGMTAYLKSTDMTVPIEKQTDLSGEQFDYIYEIHDRKDKYNNLAVHVPVMIGMQYNRFYFLAGVKVYANVWTKTNTTAGLSTYGKYEFFDDFRNMPEYQFFTDEHKSGGVKTSLNLDVDASFEIGARLGVLTSGMGFDVPKRKVEYRLAAFVDYGLFDVHTKGPQKALVLPGGYDINPESKNYVYKTRTMIDNLQLNDIMSTEGFASAVNNLMVGLKFTILFHLPEQGQCVICRDGYQSSARSHSGSSRGMKYEE